ncbi:MULTISPECIES: LysR family transcriptional regulator [Pandoraea]|uniref:LysR family transcriptional regulator n=1 Tax=Pandoraea capi TaxID=2508286 RepID=A0ABY6VRR7_9BURK|nr:MULTISPECIES: LysR family transcriptional regulator [Pandoraea]MCI3207845.1 LysR family transcriptional regulator [Pandoraea sp. LA3]MDN4585874.1 LysR family transcriptional regulator [Pandoraea capi]VVD80729.1 LysR family transcriptional regulator [Pandoraea capi]
MDDLRRIDLNLLLTLHALLAERHVSRAALRLHRSQPAVSHALAQLRGIFDDPLLVRRDGGLVLTARALELQRPLEDALDQLQGLLHAPTFDPRRARRTFRVALSDYGSRVALPALTRRLRERAPGIDIAATQASREAMLTQLLDGEIDLALGVFHDFPGELETLTLFDESFVCLADRATLPARGHLTMAQWIARPHVLVAMRPGADNEIDQALAALGHVRRVAVTLPHWSIAPELIAGTDLVLTVAERAVAHLRHERKLRRFAAPFAIPPFPFQAVWHTRRDVDPAHRWLREQIVQVCSNGQ